MNQTRKHILDMIDKHAQKARMSEYDRGVCVLAISTARDMILSIPSDVSTESFETRVKEELYKLRENYHDPDGEYTSGKGVIGALIDDIVISGNM